MENKSTSWWNADRVINLIFLSITIIIGVLALRIAIQAKDESATSNQLESLLGETNQVIATSNAQLKLARKQDTVQMNGNKNRFIAAIFRLGSVINSREYAENQVSTSCVGCEAFLINRCTADF